MCCFTPYWRQRVLQKYMKVQNVTKAPHVELVLYTEHFSNNIFSMIQKTFINLTFVRLLWTQKNQDLLTCWCLCKTTCGVIHIAKLYRIFFNAAVRKTNFTNIFTPKYNFSLSLVLYSFFVYFLFLLCLSLSVYVSLYPCVIWFSSSCCLCQSSFFIVDSFYPPLRNISFCFLTECLYSEFFCVSSISSFCLQDNKKYTRVEKYELFTFRWSYFRITFVTLHASFTSFYYIFPWRSH